MRHKLVKENHVARRRVNCLYGRGPDADRAVLLMEWLCVAERWVEREAAALLIDLDEWNPGNHELVHVNDPTAILMGWRARVVIIGVHHADIRGAGEDTTSAPAAHPGCPNPSES